MEYASAIAGGTLGFVGLNVPGAIIGAEMGYTLGKSFDRNKYINPGIYPYIRQRVENNAKRYGISLPSSSSSAAIRVRNEYSRVRYEKKPVLVNHVQRHRRRFTRKLKYEKKSRPFLYKKKK